MEQLIFLAEDDHDDVYFFEHTLAGIKADCAFRVFGNGQEVLDALKIAGSRKPDMVFLDINMPILTGLECLMNIREHFSKVLPVFLFSTDQDSLTVEQARKLGATGYLSKPSSMDELSNLLSNVMAIDWSARSENDFYVHLQLADT
ncbi:response regulator [Dyadobacter sp. CY261]|uniref:response regulator n=1 Tax=Dyadobacter sp. CY261 TaxID=2907203 RepID=UPI001F314A50|nr:response regulator [Dyadobacter sp. CY261]MCF0073044.1 response regulator [Dyadobacter sp. CY261]